MMRLLREWDIHGPKGYQDAEADTDNEDIVYADIDETQAQRRLPSISTDPWYWSIWSGIQVYSCKSADR